MTETTHSTANVPTTGAPAFEVLPRDLSVYRKGNGPSSTAERNPEIVGLVKRIAREEGVDETVFLSLVFQESRFNPCVTSPVGAYGLTQLMPGTAADLGVTSAHEAGLVELADVASVGGVGTNGASEQTQRRVGQSLLSEVEPGRALEKTAEREPAFGRACLDQLQ